MKERDVHPIYGSDIIFCLDGTGKIRGVMTWDLHSKEKRRTDLTLVARFKRVVIFKKRASLLAAC